MALTILKEADFRKALKTNPTGGYLFFGEEDYMKSAALRMARQSVTEADPAMAAFNDIRLDGLDFTPAALLDAMTVPPMGADRKVITVTGLNLSTLRAADMDKLCEALSEIPDYPYNLVIISAAADKRIFSVGSQILQLFQDGFLRSENIHFIILFERVLCYNKVS